MDFNELMNLAASNGQAADKKKNSYSYNISAPKKEQKQKPKSEVVQRLINEKEREKAKVRERLEEKLKEEAKKKIFKIPKAGSSDSSVKKKSDHEKRHRSHKSSSGERTSKSKEEKKVEPPKEKLEEKIFKDLREKNELYTKNDRARINFDGSFAVVRIAHKPRDGVPLPRRPVPAPVKETPTFNLALVKKSDKSSDGNHLKMNTHEAGGPKDVSETVKGLKEKYGVSPEGLPKKKSSTRRDNKLKEIAKYKEKIEMREKLKLQAQKDKMKRKEKPKIIKRAAGANVPPPMNFAELLKMAEKKQKEPVKVDVIKPKPKKQDEPRPMTQEEKDWVEKKREYTERKKAKENPDRPSKDSAPSRKENNSQNIDRVRKFEQDQGRSSPSVNSSKNRINNNNHSSGVDRDRKSNSCHSDKKHVISNKNNNSLDRKPAPSPHDRKPTISNNTSSSNSSKQSSAYNTQSVNSSKQSSAYNTQSVNSSKSFKNSPRPDTRPASNSNSRDQQRYEQYRGMQDKNRTNSVSNHDRTKRVNPAVNNKNRTPQLGKRKYEQTNENVLECGPSEIKKKAPRPPSPEQALNPWDRIYGNIKKNHPKRPPMKKKMVIDSEDEYDSELDDFIDDGDDGAADYSSAIRQIFGYDKRRFRDEEDDVDNMESSFSACMKEEAKSARLGLLEDLEDMKKEQEELKRKAMRKKMK
ncbi:protein SPT2 homolog [Patella vulgata]|uniref:protein SPT2 homolog n=1 Tax=Patella vulgata TaxID=6465 RepID=UPI00217FA33C|nr:protein SPT2 homolog [Patella vulgata]